MPHTAPVTVQKNLSSALKAAFYKLNPVKKVKKTCTTKTLLVEKVEKRLVKTKSKKAYTVYSEEEVE